MTFHCCGAVCWKRIFPHIDVFYNDVQKFASRDASNNIKYYQSLRTILSQMKESHTYSIDSEWMSADEFQTRVWDNCPITSKGMDHELSGDWSIIVKPSMWHKCRDCIDTQIEKMNDFSLLLGQVSTEPPIEVVE